MKRNSYIRKMISILHDNDAAIFADAGLSKEAYKYDRLGNLYLDEYDGMASSLALGIAVGTDKRVFIFCEDSEFIKEFGSVLQTAVSKCKNIFYVILNSGYYQDEGGSPTIFNSVSSPKGVLFNMGFMVHDYTKYFCDNLPKKEIIKITDRISGPMVILLRTDKGVVKSENVGIDTNGMMKRFKGFVSNRELGTSMFEF
jgi:hypothetical protein